MTCKIMDGHRITHYRVIGWRGIWFACDTDNEGQGRPASPQREVDCMACLTVVMPLPECAHSGGNVVRVISFGQEYWFLARYCVNCNAAYEARYCVNCNAAYETFMG